MASLLDIRDAVLSLQASAVTAMDLAAAALTVGTPSASQLGQAMAAITSAQTAIRAVRADLDGTDVTTCQVYDDAAVTLDLWRWERGVRASLSTLESALHAAGANLGELLSGIRETLHTVRTGETLQSIAAVYLGSWSEWPRISAANGLKAGPVAVGTVLVIPQRA